MEFRILGSIEIRKNGEPVPIVGTKTLAVLAFLALEPNRVVTTPRLIDALWEEDPPPTARNAVQVYVSKLRKALAIAGEADRLPAAGAGYRLQAEASEIDAACFERLVEEGRAACARQSHELASKTLAQAFALWRGSPLTELAGFPFATAEAARLEEVRLVALETRAAVELALGRHGSVVGELEALVGRHPFHEGFRRLLMIALYRSGRQADALDGYWTLYRELRDELGIAPSTRLQDLQQAILRHDPSVDPDLDPDLAALEDRRAGAGVPVPVSPLIGRRDEVVTVAGMLQDPNVRLLTLTGFAGVGKTRLAIELGHLLAEKFDETVFVDLQAIEDAALVNEAITRPLDTRPAAEGRQLLLVVDNFEHLLAAAPAVAALLVSTPNVKLLVTSRAPLRISGEHEFPLAPLPVPAAASGHVDALLSVPSVALFVERARAVNRDFSVDAENAAAVAQICIHLEGLPLAIELAAARSNILSPQDLRRRLESRLALLTGGVHDGPPRQRTLRAAIDWSYDLLDAGERTLFARAAVFAGGASLDSIESVCGHGLAAPLDLLEALAAKGLLRAGGSGERRFEMLETLREYAVERLALSGEETDLRARHALHYLELFEAPRRELDDADESRGLERMETERHNIRAALEFLVASGDGDAALRLASATRQVWRVRGYLDEGRRLLGHVLTATDATPSSEQLEVANAAGILAAEQGDFEAARRLFEDVIALAGTLDLPERTGAALANLGNLSFFERDYPRARSLYEESAERHRSNGNRRLLAVTFENLAAVSLAQGDVDAGIDQLGASISLAREVGANEAVASSLRALARELMARKETEQARELLLEAFELSSELGDRTAVAECLDSLAVLVAGAGLSSLAALLIGAADAQRSHIAAIRPPDLAAWTADAIAALRHDLGDELFAASYDEGRALNARSAFDRALPLAAGTTPDRD